MSLVLFIISESIFFILLILAFVFYHGRHAEGFHAQEFLNAKRTGFYTFVLLFSSFTMWLSIRGLRKQKHGAMAFWLLITILLGVTFLYGQGSEWLGLIRQDLTISRDLFGATFFTLTGFHGFHVLVGLILLTIIWGITVASPRLRPKENAVDSISLYWHFVDGVWIVVFTVIYLVPYF